MASDLNPDWLRLSVGEELKEQEQICWPPDLGVLLTNVYLDLLSNTYGVSQVAKWEKELDGKHEDFERLQQTESR